MNEADIKIFKDKVKYLLEMEAGKQYLLVFDVASGLRHEDVKKLNEMLENEFSVKVVGILLRGIENMRVLTIEESKK